MDRTVQRAFTASIPVLSGYMVLGTAFGLLVKTAGLPWWIAPFSSLLIYAGSLQFVMIGLLTSGASLVTVALTSLAVNARHLFYGISMLGKYRGAGALKPYMIFSLTDETYSLVCAVPPEIPAEKRIRYSLLVSLFDHIYWVSGTVLGVTLGSVFRFNTEGMDFALTALFVTVVTGQWMENKDHRPAIAGFGLSMTALLLFGQDSFLIPAMALIAAALLLFYAKDRRKEARDER